MNTVNGLRPRWLFNRRTGAALLCALLLLSVATVVNVIGIRLVGSIQGWQLWWRAHAGYFLVWRFLIYATTAYFWWQAYTHLKQRDADSAAQQHLRLIGAAAIITLLVQESSQWLQHG